MKLKLKASKEIFFLVIHSVNLHALAYRFYDKKILNNIKMHEEKKWVFSFAFIIVFRLMHDKQDCVLRLYICDRSNYINLHARNFGSNKLSVVLRITLHIHISTLTYTHIYQLSHMHADRSIRVRVPSELYRLPSGKRRPSDND